MNSGQSSDRTVMMRRWGRCWLAAGALACQVQSPNSPPVSPEAAVPSRAAPSQAVTGALAAAPAASAAVVGRALEFNGKPIHPGCVSELMAQVNGDSVVRSIHLSVPKLRSCGESNRYFQEPRWDGGQLRFDTEDGGFFRYQLYRSLDEHTHVLRTVTASSGTYTALSFLLVRMESAVEWVVEDGRPQQRSITTLTRLGEVSTEEEADALSGALRGSG